MYTSEQIAKQSNVRVGDTVVAFYAGAPLQHNSKIDPDHPCRARIKTIGKKWITTDSRLKAGIDGSSFILVLHISDAKEMYRESFNIPNQYRTEEQIEEYVSNL